MLRIAHNCTCVRARMSMGGYLCVWPAYDLRMPANQCIWVLQYLMIFFIGIVEIYIACVFNVCGMLCVVLRERLRGACCVCESWVRNGVNYVPAPLSPKTTTLIAEDDIIVATHPPLVAFANFQNQTALSQISKTNSKKKPHLQKEYLLVQIV